MATDIRQSKEFAQYLSLLGWKVNKINSVNYFKKKIFRIFTIIKIQRPEKIDSSEINKLIKRSKLVQIIIEPKKQSQVPQIQKLGFSKTKSPYLPSKTLILNLKLSPKNLLINSKKDARSAIRKNLKTKIKNYSLGEVEIFRKIWKKSVPPSRYVPAFSNLFSLKKVFGKNSLFITTQENTAGAIFLKSGNTTYYWYAFTNKKGRKLFHQYKIVWEGIIWAKQNGSSNFDFEGIYDKRYPNKSWLGFTHFKKSFGAKEITYPVCFAKNIFLKK